MSTPSGRSAACNPVPQSPVIPTGPGEALTQIIVLSDELLEHLRVSAEKVLSQQSVSDLVTEWNDSLDQYSRAMDRWSSWRDGRGDRPHDKADVNTPPGWDRPFVNRWLCHQVETRRRLDELRAVRDTALRAVGAMAERFPDEAEAVRRSLIDLVGELPLNCASRLVFFTPLRRMHQGRADAEQFRAAIAEGRKELADLAEWMRSNYGAIRQLASLYAGRFGAPPPTDREPEDRDWEGLAAGLLYTRREQIKKLRDLHNLLCQEENYPHSLPTLYKMPKLMAAAQAANIYKPTRQKMGRLRRGHKTADGAIEAYDSPDDED